MQQITIIMYHYVRPYRGRYPGLRVLDTEKFLEQLNYLQDNFQPVRAEDVALALAGEKQLSERACLLTFDDGYLDHYITVFPELMRRGIQGCFYPAVAAVRRDKLMDVNKLQLLLAKYDYSDMSPLLRQVEQIYKELQKEAGKELPESFASLCQTRSSAARYDGESVQLVKALLQYNIPNPWRSRILDALFREAIDVDERILAEEFYMSLDMLRVMARNGMHIGVHGASHRWLNYLDTDEQIWEIEQSLMLLTKVYDNIDFLWSVCYPFGGNNAISRKICAERGCSFGLTIEPRVAQLDNEARFALPRLDTNEIHMSI